jgi:hypothetical protein
MLLGTLLNYELWVGGLRRSGALLILFLRKSVTLTFECMNAGAHDVFDAVGKKPSGQYLGLICDESLTCHSLNSNLGYFSCFTFIFISCGESRLLVSWCAGGRCGMTDSDEDHGRSKRPDVEDRG